MNLAPIIFGKFEIKNSNTTKCFKDAYKLRLSFVSENSLRSHNSPFLFEYNNIGVFVLFTRSDQRFRWRDIAAKVSDRRLIGELTVLLLPLFYQTRCENASKFKCQPPRQVSRCFA